MHHPNQPPTESPRERALAELNETERKVWDALVDAGRPMDAVELSGATLLPVSDVLEAMQSLAACRLAEYREPEPARKRIEADDRALQEA
jgi:hypothetical protein